MYWGSRGIALCILNLSTKWRRVVMVNFTPLLLSPEVRAPSTKWVGDQDKRGGETIQYM
jgi:hypothetical protein